MSIKIIIVIVIFPFLSILHYSVPPVFKKKVHDLEAKVGSAANFDCEVEDAPDVTFRWFKSDSELRQSDKYKILNRHTTSHLEVLNSTKSDSGVYTCCASNKHGTDSCSANLYITGKLIVLYHLKLCFYNGTNYNNWDTVVLTLNIKCRIKDSNCEPSNLNVNQMWKYLIFSYLTFSSLILSYLNSFIFIFLNSLIEWTWWAQKQYF